MLPALTGVPIQELLSPHPEPPPPPATFKVSAEALSAIFRFVNLMSDMGPMGLEKVFQTYQELATGELLQHTKRLQTNLFSDHDPQRVYLLLKEMVSQGFPVPVLLELGGMALEEQARFEEAIDMLETAAQMEEDAGSTGQSRAHYLLGGLFLRHGVPGLAQRHLLLAEKSAPREGLLRVIIGYKLKELEPETPAGG